MTTVVKDNASVLSTDDTTLVCLAQPLPVDGGGHLINQTVHWNLHWGFPRHDLLHNFLHGHLQARPALISVFIEV